MHIKKKRKRKAGTLVVKNSVGLCTITDDGLLVRQQDPTPVADVAREARERGRERDAPAAGVYVGEIPVELWLKFSEQSGGDRHEMSRRLRNWFNDPDNKAFRVWQGRL